MNKLLLQSLQITYETTPDITLEHIAIEANMSLDELTTASTELNNPIAEWGKQELIASGELIETEVLTDDVSSPKDTLTKEDIAESWRLLHIEAKDLIVNTYEHSPKDLKDLAGILDTIEKAKFPKQTTVKGEIDFTKQLVKFIAEVPNDI